MQELGLGEKTKKTGVSRFDSLVREALRQRFELAMEEEGAGRRVLEVEGSFSGDANIPLTTEDMVTGIRVFFKEQRMVGKKGNLLRAPN